MLQAGPVSGLRHLVAVIADEPPFMVARFRLGLGK
jgi:hypothetical protein